MPDRLPDAPDSTIQQVWDTPTRQVRVWHNRIYSFLSKHHLNLITAGLLLCSLFFFASIQPVRNRALSSNPELFQQGQIVTITRVIDGDELRIENDRGSTRIRLLGIQSFDATANDLVVSEFGKVCVDYLETNYVGRSARLGISPKGVDGEGRLLGSLFDAETGKDLTLELVRQGLTLVYLRYGFDRLEEYKAVQDDAEREKRGLWASERVATRAESMLRLWEQERKGRGAAAIVTVILNTLKRSGKWFGTKYWQIPLLFLALILYSATGFMYFEYENNPDMTWVDAFWWSLVTMTTVGYGDYFPGTTGGRLLVGFPNMFLGVGLLGYLLSLGGAYMLESKALEVRGLKNITSENHVIICGFGSQQRLTKLIAELRRDVATANSDIVIIDDQIEELPRELQAEKILFVHGNPGREPVLTQANLMCARSTIIQACVKDPGTSDDRNLKIALAVECFNPDVFSVVECMNPENEPYFYRANVDAVVCISALSEQMLVQELQDPGIANIVAQLTSNTPGRTDLHRRCSGPLFPVPGRSRKMPPAGRGCAGNSPERVQYAVAPETSLTWKQATN